MQDSATNAILSNVLGELAFMIDFHLDDEDYRRLQDTIRILGGAADHL